LAAQTTEAILNRLTDAYAGLSPQLRRAADYVLNNPNNIGVNSMRQVASAADIKPNTLVRLARAVGFESYNTFREPFRDLLRKGTESFPDRARWLQSIAQGGSHGQLYGQMAASGLGNVEQLFSSSSADEVKAVADLIAGARTAYVLGVGIGFSLAHNFCYIARMGLDNLVQVPHQGNLPIDDIARIGRGDVLLAMTFGPYRREVVDAVRLAKRRKAKVVAITDSRSSPIAIGADRVFVTPTGTPQFFPSSAAAMVLLETLLAFMVADAGRKVVANIDEFHRIRFETGVYWDGQD
jgi:DNA-binding MurR/RpiR family transcriptional regulator